jgi:MFS family permease
LGLYWFNFSIDKPLMRVLLHIVVGAIAGFALGILLPLAMTILPTLRHPQNRQDEGFLFSILIVITAPLGAIFGAIWGYQRSLPAITLTKQGTKHALKDFEDRFTDSSIEEQCGAILRVLPEWLKEYRQVMKLRLIVTSVMVVVFCFILRAKILWLIPLAYTLRTVIVVQEMRSVLNRIRTRWGDEVVDQMGELPWTLRLFDDK